jgi:hypothetical protein
LAEASPTKLSYSWKGRSGFWDNFSGDWHTSLFPKNPRKIPRLASRQKTDSKNPLSHGQKTLFSPTEIEKDRLLILPRAFSLFLSFLSLAVSILAAN